MAIVIGRIDQSGQAALQCAQVRQFRVHRGEMRLRQVTGFKTGTLLVNHQLHQASDLLERKIQITAAPNERHPSHIFIAVAALAAHPCRAGQQTDLFVVADCRRGRPRRIGKLADPQSHTFMVARGVLTLKPLEVGAWNHAIK